ASFIAQYGWYLLGAGLLLYYIRLKSEPYFMRLRELQEERKFAELCKKNPDLIRSRQEAMEAARLRMQEKLNEDAKMYAEKQKQREAKRREEMLTRKEGRSPNDLGHRLGNTSDSTSEGQASKKNSNNKPDYNPLMGSGGSSGYRPPRRSCPGGGCG
ncbi:hypothetical protein L9F63_005688, partial [Diploptera punctata]